MPLYHFHLYADDAATTLPAQRLPGLIEARGEARMLAIEHISRGLDAGIQFNPEHRIEIVDDAGTLVFTVRFGDLL